MTTRLFLLVTIFALAAGSTTATGCGGGDSEVTAEHYLRRLEEAIDNFKQQGETLGSEWEANVVGAESNDEQVEAIRRSYNSLASLVDDFHSRLAGIEAPNELEEADSSLVGIVGELSGVWSEVSAALDSAEPQAGPENTVLYDKIDALEERFETACIQLQEAADDMGLDVDLRCKEELYGAHTMSSGGTAPKMPRSTALV